MNYFLFISRRYQNERQKHFLQIVCDRLNEEGKKFRRKLLNIVNKSCELINNLKKIFV